VAHAVTIRIAIVDDHPVVREGTAAVLAQVPELEVVALAGSLLEAQQLVVRRQDIDVVLLDIRLGSESGLNLLAGGSTDVVGPQIDAERRPAVLLLTAYDYPQYAEAALRLGAAGFVLKTAPLSELVDAIRRVAAGGLAFAVRPRTSGTRSLSEREHEVVRLVVDGHSNDEIGARLGIGAKTVETHLRRLFERFDLASRTELATRALREGWLDVPAGR
jgi:DNA-binding NarL/FixJ family response regulator